MTDLLVSVRDAEEAIAALAGGTSILDIKEPSRGSLGAADPTVWSEVHSIVRTRGGTGIRLSAALGELLEDPVASDPALQGFDFAKVGLAGCAGRPNWSAAWRAWAESLPAGTRPVAVWYADSAAAGAPGSDEVLAAVTGTRATILLIDTWDKSGGDLWAHCPSEAVKSIVAAARRGGLQVALAGSLHLRNLDQALACDPDIVAVRGAVCRAGRTSSIERDLVKRFADRLSTVPSKVAECAMKQVLDGEEARL